MGDGGHWKWPRIWRRLDELERRGAAYRAGDPVNFEQPNPNAEVVPQSAPWKDVKDVESTHCVFCSFSKQLSAVNFAHT